VDVIINQIKFCCKKFTQKFLMTNYAELLNPITHFWSMMPRDRIYSSIFLMLVLVLGFVSYQASFPSIGLVFADDDCDDLKGKDKADCKKQEKDDDNDRGKSDDKNEKAVKASDREDDDDDDDDRGKSDDKNEKAVKARDRDDDDDDEKEDEIEIDVEVKKGKAFNFTFSQSVSVFQHMFWCCVMAANTDCMCI